MPIFDFECPKCHKVKEIIIFSGSQTPMCNKCKKEMVKLMGAPSTVFKGDGFYKEGFSK